MSNKIQLTLTEEQAKIVSTACEFYARVRMGQFGRIIDHTLDLSIPCDNYCDRRDEAEKAFARSQKTIVSRTSWNRTFLWNWKIRRC